mmetsp:Transcript_9243/g.19941  ORF Transcript_9243/g.19941 Transcript_9243/m.19941 type:complete len:210 (-) Transcript_9243:442-1071(-)
MRMVPSLLSLLDGQLYHSGGRYDCRVGGRQVLLYARKVAHWNLDRLSCHVASLYLSCWNLCLWKFANCYYSSHSSRHCQGATGRQQGGQQTGQMHLVLLPMLLCLHGVLHEVHLKECLHSNSHFQHAILQELPQGVLPYCAQCRQDCRPFLRVECRPHHWQALYQLGGDTGILLFDCGEYQRRSQQFSGPNSDYISDFLLGVGLFHGRL